jgi:hypothetical protein
MVPSKKMEESPGGAGAKGRSGEIAGAATHVQYRCRSVLLYSHFLLCEAAECLAQQDRLHDFLTVARGPQKLGKADVIIS